MVASGIARVSGTQPPSVMVTRKSWPCRWIGWLVMVRLPILMRTRSPSLTGSTSMPGNTRALNVHMLKSVISVTFGSDAPGVDVVAAHDEDEVAVDAVQGWIARMHHDHAHHPHGHLHHLVGMGVVHEGAALLEHELVDEGLAGGMCGCVSPATPSMPFGTSMPCQWTRRVLGQPVGDEDADLSPSTASMVGPGAWPL